MTIVKKILFNGAILNMIAPAQEAKSRDGERSIQIYGCSLSETTGLSIDISKSANFAGINFSNTDARSTLALTCFNHTLGISVEALNQWFHANTKQGYIQYIELCFCNRLGRVMHVCYSAIFQIHQMYDNNHVKQMSVKLADNDYQLFLSRPFDVMAVIRIMNLSTKAIVSSKRIGQYMPIHTIHQQEHMTDELSRQMTAAGTAAIRWKIGLGEQKDLMYNTVNRLKDQENTLFFDSAITPVGFEHLKDLERLAVAESMFGRVV